MSKEKLRELKLYKKLEKDLTYREKLEEKIRQISNQMPSVRESSNGSRKINNNKKYFMEEQKNAEIERKNRILFQKINSEATKSYYKNPGNKNRSSKTLNSNEESDDYVKKSIKYKNWSENKINSSKEQSRISFEESEEMMRPKHKSNQNKMKMITELSPEIIDLLKSRMIESRTIEQKEQETVLFQGVCEIDTIKFKVKICIRNKIYYLTGRNKHTEIMLKMELNEYKKFHKEVLKGNPSNIFNYLKIDKGQIRFRTRQEEEEIKIEEERNKKRIYRIQEEEENEDFTGEISSYPKRFEKSKIKKISKMEESYNYSKQNEKMSEEEYINANNCDKLTKTREKPNKNHEIYDENELESDIIKKITIYNNQKKTKSIDRTLENENIDRERKYHRNVNPEQIEKTSKINNFNTLEDYINSKKEHIRDKNILKTTIDHRENVEIEGKAMKNHYKLPYL